VLYKIVISLLWARGCSTSFLPVYVFWIWEGPIPTAVFNNRSFCRFAADLAWLLSHSVHRDARFDFDYGLGLALVMVPRLLAFGGSGSEDREVVSCVPVSTFGVAIIASSVCVNYRY